ncbi:MAG: PAS-domain containing protein [Beijerinckiaceae bacterium]|nr:PAS-domain containing protein [Beijerinckiaceae bacterium]
MTSAVVPVFIVLAYLGGLYLLARFGCRASHLFDKPRPRTAIYLLGCCISWGYPTCLGLAGLGGEGGETMLIWLVPVVVFGLGGPVIRRMVRFARDHNVTTIADFATAAYGKKVSVGAIIAVILFVASIPLNALMLNAIGVSFAAILGDLPGPSVPGPARAFCLFVTAALMVFVIAIGTRRPDNRGHQRGIGLVVATEILMRFMAVCMLGIFVTWGMFDGISGLLSQVRDTPRVYGLLVTWPHWSVVSFGLACASGLLFLTSQFQMTITENQDFEDLRKAGWFVPLLTGTMILFALPILIASLILYPDQGVHVIAMNEVPLHSNSGLMVAAGLVAGFGAMTSLMLVGSTSIATVVSNDLVMPLLLYPWFRRRRRREEEFGTKILTIRRIAIVASFVMAGGCSVLLDAAKLAVLMQVAVVLFAQIIPPCLFAVAFTNLPARGAIHGVVAGIAVLLYTMVLPIIGQAFEGLDLLLTQGPFHIAWLRPDALFGLHTDPFTHVMLWSVGANFAALAITCAICMAGTGSRAGRLFFNRSSNQKYTSLDGFFRPDIKVTLDHLREVIAHYLGEGQTNSAFEAYFARHGTDVVPEREADTAELQFGEDLLATAIGKATSHLVVSLLLKRQDIHGGETETRLDLELEGGGVLRAAPLASRHGMSLFDKNLRLVAWNNNGLALFTYFAGVLQVGLSLPDVIRYGAQRGAYGPGPVDDIVASRLAALLDTSNVKRQRTNDGRVYDCRSLRLADGFLVLHHIDVTEELRAEETLEAENETLERRVRERTEELQRLNGDLIKAKAEAEAANISKTRFLAAASHDLLQPLNAARLYATSLKEQVRARMAGDDCLALALNVEDSLEAVEDILTALLDISRLDAGATKPDVTAFAINDIFRQLQLEFAPAASKTGLTVTFVPSSLPIVSDKRLLRRLLRNLVSNAIKYTDEGRVIIGVRHRGDQARIEIWDTGLGIPKSKQRAIFREFERLPNAMRTAPGVGLGLSIVERLGRVLNHEIHLRSQPGRGSVFSVMVPRASEIPATKGIAPGAGGATQRSLEGLVVAAIDNEMTILNGLRALLGGWECQVVTGEDLPGIIDALGKAKLVPDVVIADYHLGKSDGLAVIAALRAHFGACHAVLITADRSPVVRDLAHAMDVRFLNKPVKPAVLRSLLSQWRLVKQAAE